MMMETSEAPTTSWPAHEDGASDSLTVEPRTETVFWVGGTRFASEAEAHAYAHQRRISGTVDAYITRKGLTGRDATRTRNVLLAWEDFKRQLSLSE